MVRRRRKMLQLELPPKGRGGRRPGAGRPKEKKSGVPHLVREVFAARFPLHVTLKIRAEVGSLRTDRRFLRIKRAFRYGCDRFGMRLTHFSVQGNHIHLIVEAQSREALAKGMQGLAIRLAKGVNRAAARNGTVFADRYHSRVLRTLEEVRNAVHYVLHNQQKHRREQGRWTHPREIDSFSSASGEGCWFVDEKWRSSAIVVAPRSWLLTHAPPSAIG
jgi:REP element-mobilizing transposase RayT